MTHLVLLAAWFVGVRALTHVEDMKTQERLLLSSLGLSERPRPAGGHQPRRHIPSVLWRMFRRSDIQSRDSDPCTVSEYGVRGNIIRYVQDQGRGKDKNTRNPAMGSCHVKSLVSQEHIGLLIELQFKFDKLWFCTDK